MGDNMVWKIIPCVNVSTYNIDNKEWIGHSYTFNVKCRVPKEQIYLCLIKVLYTQMVVVVTYVVNKSFYRQCDNIFNIYDNNSKVTTTNSNIPKRYTVYFIFKI